MFATFASTASAINTNPTACPTVDIRQHIDLGDNRNQRFLPWCYAYPSADLLTARIGHPVSTFDIGLLLAREQALNSNPQPTHLIRVGGGSLKLAAHIINKYGFCSEYRFSANHIDASAMLALAEQIAVKIQADKSSGLISDEQIAGLVLSNESKLRLIFPEINIEKLIRIFQEIGSEKFPIVSVVEKVCGGRTRIKQQLDVAGTDQPTRMETAKKILKAGSPIYIRWAEKTVENLDLPVGPPGHGSSIVAMRFDHQNRQGEFLIRNSYGADLTTIVDPRIREDVEGGNIWVSQDLAEKMIYSISWLR